MITVLPGIRGIGVGVAAAKINTVLDLGIDYFLIIREAPETMEPVETDAELVIEYLPIVVPTLQSEPATARVEALLDYQRVIFSTSWSDAATAAIDASIAYQQTVYGPGELPQAATATHQLLIVYEIA
jgi:hypothetical protein